MKKGISILYSILFIFYFIKAEYEDESYNSEARYGNIDQNKEEEEAKILSCFLFTNMQMKKDNMTISNVALSLGEKNKYIDKVFISMINKCIHKITSKEINELSSMARSHQYFNFEKYVIVNYYSLKNDNLQFSDEETNTMKKIQILTKKLENLKNKFKKPESSSWFEFLKSNSIGIFLWFIVLIIISSLSISLCFSSDQETEKLMELLKKRKEEFEHYDKDKKAMEKEENKKNQNNEKIEPNNSNSNSNVEEGASKKEKSENKTQEITKERREKDYFDNRSSMYDVD